jgi:hypothetical protein
VVTLNGWSSKFQGGVHNWKTQGATDGGVVYIFAGNFDGKLGDSTSPLELTLILEAAGGDTCSAPATGSVELAGNSNFFVHSSLSSMDMDIALVAQGDIDYQGGATVGGAIFATEQIDYRGNADSWGAVVATETCHTTGSPLTNSTLSGTSVINYPGPLTTPFSASTLRAEVVGWYEL